MSTPKTMRTLFQPSAEEPRLVLIPNHPVPVPREGTDEHLIHVRSVSPCANELNWAKNFPHLQTRELIPCYDIAGTIVAAPPTSDFQPGAEVYARSNYMSPGCARDYTLVGGAELARRPRNVDWAHATSIPLSAQTALQALFVQSGIGGLGDSAWKGKRVLVTAASGGVGSWVVQLGRVAGATVIGTCGPQNVDFVKGLGAEEVVNYREVDLKAWGQKAENQVDLVVDCIGKKSLEDAWWCVKEGGTLISIFQPPEQVQPEECKEKNVKNFFFIVAANRSDLETITKLVEEGKCHGVVDSIWPLEQFEDAFKRLDSGHARGKIILDLTLNQ
ncbi:NADP-dependent oxidoreductase [Aspergillus clavatus NRRL 1]|uniref:Zinc-binding oxidoreductase, putative n=1 Tax=Aspergillus clavatus (strain ATCC 1007 / CBS 513.65 / DSM 816 / NCTC 3887 / NRRL 1 / QM 1276 / 107) TaxID=344612 RepID=A1C5L7_ASPCL|nr:zinc-binding oxidoreductase, putative [Aspergillus clavatus NRRL 1]EAW14985.1 zinc-binding oxidoreductase, putative [Aspergillus clavatus NRRL 1]